MNQKNIKSILKNILRGNNGHQNGYNTDYNQGDFTEKAFSVAKQIRGENQPLSIIIQGVMPRDTVYVGKLLRLHPDLFAYPNQM